MHADFIKMDILNKYTISRKENKNGTYHFNYEIDADAFKTFVEDEIKDAEVLANVEMKSSSSETILQINLTGKVTVECDRCLDDLVIPVEFEGVAKAVYEGNEESDEEYDIIYFSPEDEMIVLDEYLYESILLCLPTQKVHADISDCNPAMLEKFSIVSQEEFDNITAQQQTMGENPEFEKLKALKNEMEK